MVSQFANAVTIHFTQIDTSGFGNKEQWRLIFFPEPTLTSACSLVTDWEVVGNCFPTYKKTRVGVSIKGD